ncbi:DUF4339 domain-containing protein [Verrucomicrobiales bacterium]|nr:DUF4339 domain-containing protein [Verrucomicrobiales bacterium]
MDWYYAKDGQQVGPVSQEELENCLANGTINAETLIWKEGMAQWQPAGQILSGVGSAPAASVPVATTAAAATPAVSSDNPYAAPTAASPLATGGGGTGEITARIKRASFPTYLVLMILGWGGFIVGMIFAQVGEQSGDENVTMIGGFAIMAGMIPLIWGSILSFIYLYRCWLIVCSANGGMARTTPGKAVGFLFIPFYNLYWVFVAYSEWSKDYNLTGQRFGWPRVQEGLFLTYAVLTVAGAVPIINYLAMLGQLVVTPMTVFQMCKTINYHANA